MRKGGVLHAEVEIEVPFFDVDSMDVVWHGHYVKYFEEARCALLDKLGHNYRQMRDAGYAWPVIDLQLRYIRGAQFGQRIRVRADLVDSAAASDALTTGAGQVYVEALADGLAAGDALTSAAVCGETMTDTLAASDALGSVAVLSVLLADLAAGSDIVVGDGGTVTATLPPPTRILRARGDNRILRAQ